MAKPTDEIIALPTFTSELVSKTDAGFETTSISLKDLHDNAENADKGLILYFYPRDNTPGCTTQAVDFTTMQAQFANIGYTIVGVSRDSVESHQKFIDKKELGLQLISDADEALCNHFDVIKEKNMYGKKTLGLVRSTFVFDKTGKLTHTQRNLRAKDYAQRLFDTLNS